MRRSPHFSEQVNPYVRMVHDHPATLLADPDPARLAAARAAAPSPGRRLVVDLGCGSGNFLRTLAARHPADHFVGFELRFKRLVKGARKLEKRGLRNTWLLREEAHRCADYFERGSVSAVHLNFPDPWPKVSHWRKRLVQPGFLADLRALLAADGYFLLKTDHSGYFLHVLSLVDAERTWRITGFANDLHRRPVPGAEVASEFEELFRHQRKAIFALRLEARPQSPDTSPPDTRVR